MRASEAGVEPLGGSLTLPFDQMAVASTMHVDECPTKSPTPRASCRRRASAREGVPGLVEAERFESR